MQPPWIRPPAIVDPTTGQVQYFDRAGNIFWGPPGLMPLQQPPLPQPFTPPPVPAPMAHPSSKGYEEKGRDKGSSVSGKGDAGKGDAGKGKGGGGGYGPVRRGGDEEDKGKGKGDGKATSSSSSRTEPWGPYRTGWLNKCTDLVVLILREKNSEAWQLAKAHANSSSMFPLLPTDIKNMF
jgi:hypothetical protein